MRPAGLLVAVMLVALALAGCGGGDGSGASSTAAPPATGALTTDTPCADWLAASADAKAQALESTAVYTDGGINAWIAETRRTLAATPEEAATVPDTVPVDEGVALVDRACAAVAPDDTVASAIPAVEFQAGQGTTAP